MAAPSPPILYIFSGLPGTGKSTLAKRLARHTGAAYLRIDTIEQGLRDLCGTPVVDEGYRLAYRIARENLLVGVSVVADSCNPIGLTRRAWMAVAKETGSRFLNIEVVCSDSEDHRRRVETRPADVDGLKLPTWEDVLARNLEPWTEARITLDTANTPEDRSFRDLLSRANP